MQSWKKIQSLYDLLKIKLKDIGSFASATISSLYSGSPCSRIFKKKVSPKASSLRPKKLPLAIYQNTPQFSVITNIINNSSSKYKKNPSRIKYSKKRRVSSNEQQLYCLALYLAKLLSIITITTLVSSNGLWMLHSCLHGPSVQSPAEHGYQE